MTPERKVNILLVDDQPGKLMSYEVILAELDENLLKASSATEALQILLKTDVAVLLVDVCMPDLDGFQFAAMVRNHPRFEKTAIIFISATHLSDMDSVKGYELGAVDYVPVPVVPELLRAKVRVFVDLYRKSTQLERLNAELEDRVALRTKELEDAIKSQELLAREVDHRAKNALAVIQSIVRMTKAGTVVEFGNVVNGRIRAMGNVHTLLSESRWLGADLKRLAEEELAPYQNADRVSMTGPSIVLRPAVAQIVALAIHELATNAAKYGCLSQEGGRVLLSWVATGTSLNIVWDETGGPPAKAPETIGFGIKVIEASVASQSYGDVAFNWRPSGLRCTLNIPEALEPAATTPRRAPLSAHARHDGEGARELQGARVMVVEDEALIALMLVDVLHECGAEIVGPFNVVDAALACDEDFDVAVLDVNVAGELVYPLAEKLLALGRPFVFSTGYDDGGIDQRFSRVAVIQKPIEMEALPDLLGRAILTHREDAAVFAQGASRVAPPLAS